jgi:hypothetical protein
MKKQIWMAAVSAGALMLSACADPSPTKKSSSDDNGSSVATSGIKASQQGLPDQSKLGEADESSADEMGRDADEYARFKAEQAGDSSLGASVDQNTTPPIAVSVEMEIDNDGDMHPNIYIKSLSDNIKILDVVLNRGNCNMNLLNKGRMPFDLVYGQRTWDRAWDNNSGRACSVSEVLVQTDRGSFSFNF